MLLNFVISIGAFLTLLKGAELILRPYQRKAIQSFLEDITLRLETMDFAQVSNRLATPEAQFCFLLLSYFEFGFLVVLVLLLQAPEWRPGGMLAEHLGAEMYYFQIGIILICCITLAFAWKWPLPALLRLIVGDARNKWILRLRFAAFIFAGYAFLMVYQLALMELFGTNSKGYLIGLAVIYPLFILFFVLFQTIAAMLQAKTRMVRWLFVLMRGLMWRLIEYDKGPVAAMILITTVVLTLYKSLLE